MSLQFIMVFDDCATQHLNGVVSTRAATDCSTTMGVRPAAIIGFPDRCRISGSILAGDPAFPVPRQHLMEELNETPGKFGKQMLALFHR